MPSLSRSRFEKSREADPLFRREMRERWRRPLTLLQLAVFALVLGVVGFGFYVAIVPQGEVMLGQSIIGSGRRFFQSVATLNALAWIPGGLLLAAPTLSAERERGHLAPWVLAGLTPRGIARAKFRALAGFVLVMVCVPFPIFAICFPLGGVSPGEFGGALLLTIAVALLSCATGLMVSAQWGRVAGAMGGALLMSACFLPVGGALVVGLLAAPWPLVAACALGLLLVVPGCVAVAARNFEFAVRADLSGEPNPDFGRAAPVLAAGAAVKAELRGLADEIVPRPRTNGTRGGEAGEPKRRRVLNDEPLSDLESALSRLAKGNAVARREWGAHLLNPRADWSDGSLRTQRWPEFFALWTTTGLLGLGLKLYWLPSTPYQWFGVLVMLALLSQAALGAAPRFVRERALRMLASLQLTALSPLDITVGKLAATLLICAQFFAGPLLSLAIMGLSYGPRCAVMTVAAAACGAAGTAAGALLLSLWGRRTEVVAGGALGATALMWIGLPTLYIGQASYFVAPPWLEFWWLRPFRVFLDPPGDWALALALGQLAVECALGTLVLVALCAWQLRRTRAEDENMGVLGRDLSRSWR